MNYFIYIFKYLLNLLRSVFDLFLLNDPSSKSHLNDTIVPESVNFHFTRQCNYQCELMASVLVEDFNHFTSCRRFLFSHCKNVFPPSFARVKERPSDACRSWNEESELLWW